jgi:hypothetical protein
LASQPESKRIARAMAAVNCHAKFSKFITTLRTAGDKRDGSPDNGVTSHDDLFDAFRLSLQFWYV